ncbi:monocarboxylate transporter 13-like isoform X2 [Acanthaster planci]|uniref:Monocarboxylate transporter 13-like isoform X2 n=1 Tax=Acanthaster planci TaxID=133434 RepID=A0A8B7Z5E1_ACAPL|nr:monocarboxylate transporter 13-like isoform X2 [Acanthaster planci]XP_022098551.1 monocarboxylate transporter 13-like isoform X2 [Acanthaster planci]
MVQTSICFHMACMKRLPTMVLTHRNSAVLAMEDEVEVDYVSLEPRTPLCRQSVKRRRRGYMSSPGVAPDGGWGWFVLLAAHSTLIFREGIAKCLGVFLPTFRDVFGTSTSLIGMISSLCVTFADFTGLISGPLCQRFGCRPVAVVGGIFASSGLIIAAFFAQTTLQLSWLLAVAGIGLGLALTPSLVMISRYFDKRYSMANGLAYSGSGVGILTLAPLSQVLIDTYGWRGALSIIGAMCLHVTACGALLRPLRGYDHGKKDEEKHAIGRRYQRIPSNCDENGIDSCADTEEDTITPGAMGLSEPEKECKRSCCRSCCSSCWESSEGILGLSLFTEPPFVLLMVVQFCGRFTYMGWLIYLIPHAIEKGISPIDATFLASVAGVTNIIARASHGVLVDRKCLTATQLLAVAAILAAVSLLLDPVLNTFNTLTAASLAYGLASGIYFPISVVVVKEAVNPAKFANALGWSYGFAGVGRMLAGFVTGWLFDYFGNYDISFIVLGSIQLSAVFLLLVSCLIEYCRKSRKIGL